MTPDFIQLAKAHKRRIVLPESDDQRILEAAIYCDTKGIAEIILVGDPTILKAKLSTLNLSAGNIQIVNPSTSENTQAFANALYDLRSKKGLTKEQSEEFVHRPLYFANLMVHQGLADGCVAGAINSTGDVIRAALQIIGTKTRETRLSSSFIMITPSLPTPVLFADCAINIEPDAPQLADIALQSAKNIKALLGIEPKVAMLSFSTNGSARHENVDKVAAATAILHSKYPEINAIGEIQFDAAISNEILKKKWDGADFETPANVFVFPSLEAGNIGCKITERIGGATAVGPILQGLDKPINDLSRGADVKSIINTIAVTCLQVNDEKSSF